MRLFLCDDFLLKNNFAKTLYHNYAKDLPIIDYHCHLPPAQINMDHKFQNIAQIWLYGDHYKWRAMRTNGGGRGIVRAAHATLKMYQCHVVRFRHAGLPHPPRPGAGLP